MKMQFRKCKICGNIIGVIHDSGAPIICCGQEMNTIIPNTIDTIVEKHVPLIERNGNTIRVYIGEQEHPMADKHYIQWIAIETKMGNQRKELHPFEKPFAEFALMPNDELISAFAYCNLHGLWKNQSRSQIE